MNSQRVTQRQAVHTAVQRAGQLACASNQFRCQLCIKFRSGQVRPRTSSAFSAAPGSGSDTARCAVCGAACGAGSYFLLEETKIKHLLVFIYNFSIKEKTFFLLRAISSLFSRKPICSTEETKSISLRSDAVPEKKESMSMCHLHVVSVVSPHIAVVLQTWSAALHNLGTLLQHLAALYTICCGVITIGRGVPIFGRGVTAFYRGVTTSGRGVPTFWRRCLIFRFLFSSSLSALLAADTNF